MTCFINFIGCVLLLTLLLSTVLNFLNLTHSNDILPTDKVSILKQQNPHFIPVVTYVSQSGL